MLKIARIEENCVYAIQTPHGRAEPVVPARIFAGSGISEWSSSCYYKASGARRCERVKETKQYSVAAEEEMRYLGMDGCM
jgi:hypothetical protein